MRPSSLLLACTLALSLTGGAVRAQDAPTPPRTLAQALAALQPPKQDLFLTVGADKITLPPNVPPPDPDSRPGQVGAAYGRLVRDFGGVMALAPPGMVVLNTRPGVPDPYDGLPADEALKLLLAGLTPPQWDALTGPSGLGVADLSDDGQRALFRAVLPSGELMALPEYSPFIPSPSSEPIALVARHMDAARLRLGRRMQIDIPMAGPTKTSAGYRAPLSPGVVGYEANSVPPDRRDTLYGAVLRQTLANNPKEADLNYNAATLTQSIGLEGIATVGDLIARVGKAAGLELYADRRYEGRTVTLVGRRTARGVDLLRAVAFCVTGTFRRVGPAYVLTDDLQGAATRHQRLARFVQEAEMARHAVVDAAGDDLVTAHGGVDMLPWLGGLGFSDAQQALPQFNRGTMGGDIVVPFTQLTPAQQQFALDRADQVASSGDTRLDLGGQFTLQARTHLLLLPPAAPGPFLLDYLSVYQAFQLSSRREREIRLKPWTDAAKKNPLPMIPPPIPPHALTALLAPLPRRAVLAAPRTAREVDQVITEMQALGLNQLWLDVFSGGHSYLDDTQVKPHGVGPNLLTEALARAKGTGIAVIPALDLLRWGANAPTEARDLTALGETSAQQQAWERRHTNVMMDLAVGVSAQNLPTDIWACPAAPVVEATLLALVRRLAATPGVTTLVLRDTVTSGYYQPPGSNFGLSDAELGYVPALRLAFLRRDHRDPVDLGWDTTLPGGTDMSLPEFDDIQDIEALSQAGRDWNRLRDGVSRDLLQRLLAAGQDASGRRFRFLVPQRGNAGIEGWYGLWEDAQVPLPEVPAAGVFGPLHPPWARDYAQAAHSQCRINLRALPVWAIVSPYLVADMLRKLKPGWDGVVLDATGPSGGDQFAGLARSATPSPLPQAGEGDHNR